MTERPLLRRVEQLLLQARTLDEEDIPTAVLGLGRRMMGMVDKEPRPYEPFPVELLPEPLCSYVTQGSKAIDIDSAMVALPLLTGIAGIIGNSREIELKSGYVQPSVLWMGVIADSGEAKTPALEKALRRIREVDSANLLRFREELGQYEIDHKRWKKDHQQWERDKGGGDPPEEPRRPVATQIIVSDITIEALGDVLVQNPRGLLLVVDELAGWIRGFDQYRPVRGSDVEKWLSIHGAGPITVNRKGKDTSHVPRAAVSVTGTIQPGVLENVFTQDLRANGLMARLLLAWPPPRDRRWNDHDISEDCRRRLGLLVKDILALRGEEQKEGWIKPRRLKLSPQARPEWEEFFNGLSDRRRRARENANEDLVAALAKLEGAAARLAIVIHEVRCATQDLTLEDPFLVDDESLDRATRLAYWFGDEEERIYTTLAGSQEADPTPQRLALLERKGRGMTVRAYAHSRGLKIGDAQKEIERLQQAGVVRVKTPETGPRGGRPSPRVELVDDAEKTGQNWSKPVETPGGGRGKGVSNSFDQFFGGENGDESDSDPGELPDEDRTAEQRRLVEVGGTAELPAGEADEIHDSLLTGLAGDQDSPDDPWEREVRADRPGGA
jgi:hypothetical protein